jgi:hypothetical protein
MNFYNHQALKKLEKKLNISKNYKTCAPVSDSCRHAARAGCQWTQSRGDPRQNSPPSKGNHTKPYQTKS